MQYFTVAWCLVCSGIASYKSKYSEPCCGKGAPYEQIHIIICTHPLAWSYTCHAVCLLLVAAATLQSPSGTEILAFIEWWSGVDLH